MNHNHVFAGDFILELIQLFGNRRPSSGIWNIVFNNLLIQYEHAARLILVQCILLEIHYGCCFHEKQ